MLVCDGVIKVVDMNKAKKITQLQGLTSEEEEIGETLSTTELPELLPTPVAVKLKSKLGNGVLLIISVYTGSSFIVLFEKFSH